MWKAAVYQTSIEEDVDPHPSAYGLSASQIPASFLFLPPLLFPSFTAFSLLL
jgi:hypothetical protein